MTIIEVFHMLKIVFLIFGILLLIGAVFEFFAFNIKKIFQDITGLTKKREIKQMSENTEYTGQLKHKSAFKSNQKMMTNTGKLRNPNGGTTTGKLSGVSKKAFIEPPKEKADTNSVKPVDMKNKSAAYDESETAILNNTNSAVMPDSEAETAVLTNNKVQEKAEHAKNTENTKLIDSRARKNIHFLLEKQILLIHTNEQIEW